MLNRKSISSLVKAGDLSPAAKRQMESILKNKKEVLPGWSPTFLRRLGDVKTIIDIGVLNGTPALYKAFPNAHLILIEALPKYEETCRTLIQGRSGEIHMCAAGSEDGDTVIRHYPDLPAQSSILKTVRETSLHAEEISIPIRRLDTLFKGRTFERDVLLKIDTEGFEYNIIKGALETLKQVKFCITETSIRHRHQNSYRFADLIELMAENNFSLYDVLTVTREKAMRPQASIMDAIFINETC